MIAKNVKLVLFSCLLNFIAYSKVHFIYFKKTVAQSSFFFKSVVIFADFVLISAKMTTLLKEMRILKMNQL